MKPYERLLQSLRRLPGVGPKQAERLALHLLRAPHSEVEELSHSILEAKSSIGMCAGCLNYTDGDLCRICRDDSRDAATLCVVEEPTDVRAVEATGAFKGFYHVLHGSISPLDGIGPERLKIKELLDKVRDPGKHIQEVIVATDPDAEGEATSLYLAQLLKPLGVKVTRIAQGVPLGGDLDYIDEVTLSHSLSGRKEI
jgi:recombination protein RecR